MAWGSICMLFGELDQLFVSDTDQIKGSALFSLGLFSLSALVDGSSLPVASQPEQFERYRLSKANSNPGGSQFVSRTWLLPR